ncbi:hypothetical protein [Sinobaca sp. H24]|uniref:hypothetical protein n=1 Tax=Sinobaca sp. H24 TaxID=2923376 RepID=UPI00207A8BC1|nr:hypothetical protein [Sinobaca sp. H24]
MRGYTYYVECKYYGRWIRLFNQSIISADEYRSINDNQLFLPYYKNWEWGEDHQYYVRQLEERPLRITKMIKNDRLPHCLKSKSIFELRKWQLTKDGILATEYKMLHAMHA